MKPKATVFKFCDYIFDHISNKITFNYRLEFSNRDAIDFTETLIFSKSPKNYEQTPLKNILDSLHLVLGISYYKLYCPPKIETTITLSKDQADFWNTVYKKGLGEFIYLNNLDPKSIATFPYSKNGSKQIHIKTYNRALLGIGGGKDSIVAAELLKDFGITTFLVETQQKDVISDHIIDAIGKPSLRVSRFLDPKIFNKYPEAYNGHIPISAIFAFIGLLSAAIYEYKYVVVGNEHSSNFGNIIYKGEEINHQWSKSIEFEKMLQEYTRKFISPDIIYFSLLRQYYEIRIAQLFAEHKKYFKLFSSCNRNFKVHKERPTSLWCGECPKCAFVFLMLAPFIEKKELIGIFKKNLLADDALIPLYQDILGFGKLKPFDCVGTFEESQAALFLCSKKFNDEVIVNKFLPYIKDPKELVNKVFKKAISPTIPTQFRLLGVKRVCILGYGKEGRVSEQYLKKYYPHLEVDILNQDTNDDYLKLQEKYDLAVKTPGISKTKVAISYVTATNLFFSQINNFTIGVTGSKGKSTTASLIYEILKQAGKKVRLIGNIGNPMLEVLLTDIDPDEIFVIELSSYMLDDIEYSPNIGLLLNLFPEHLDYHNGVDNYYKAKQNIFKYQRPEDIAIKPPFEEAIPLDKDEIPLLGDHNIQNIKAAVKVARLLKIPDIATKKGIKNFKSLPHRIEYIGTYEGIKFYDDAISTTPESTIMAIKALTNVGTILLGGEDRGYDFVELEKMLRLHKVKNIVLFPDSGNRILRSKNGFNIIETKSMEEAVNFAFQNTQKGEICLLSTASPSYSLWKNFEEKGNLFQDLVKNY
jgi:UDP-N-acetylmuramoylalanine--D-glutamate ligase